MSETNNLSQGNINNNKTVYKIVRHHANNENNIVEHKSDREDRKICPKLKIDYNSEEFKYGMAISACCLFLATILICILIPISFWYINYDEYAFDKNNYGIVNTNKIYYQGRYFKLITHEPLIFSSTYQKMDFTGENDITIFTYDGYQISLNIVFWYRIPAENLSTIYKTYSMNYKLAVVNSAKLIIKNLAGSSGPDGLNIPLQSYVTSRTYIQNQFAQYVQINLNLLGFDAPVKMFQLLDITIPSLMITQYLNTVLQYQDNIIQQNQQEVTKITATTTTLVSEINAKINLTLSNAVIKSNQIIINAKSEANKITQSMRSNTISTLFNNLNITDPNLKQRYIMILATMDNPNYKIIYSSNSQIFNIK